jgi:hypothetical protein
MEELQIGAEKTTAEILEIIDLALNSPRFGCVLVPRAFLK